MGTITSEITSLASVYSAVWLFADQRAHQNSASLAFVWGIHRRPVKCPHKGPVARIMFSFDDVVMIMKLLRYWCVRVFIVFQHVLAICQNPDLLTVWCMFCWKSCQCIFLKLIVNCEFVYKIEICCVICICYWCIIIYSCTCTVVEKNPNNIDIKLTYLSFCDLIKVLLFG